MQLSAIVCDYYGGFFNKLLNKCSILLVKQIQLGDNVYVIYLNRKSRGYFMKKFFGLVIALLIAAAPITVMAGNSPTGTKNGGGYDGCATDNISLAAKGCRAYVNGQWVTSLGNGMIVTDAGNVYDANGNFMYNVNGGGAGATSSVASQTTFRFTRADDSTTFEDCNGVYVDDVWVDPANYQKTKGSVIITLKQAFLDTLSAGQHKLTVTFTNSEPQSVYFTITKQRRSGVPNTGESSKTPYYIMLGGALIVIAGTGYILFTSKH